MVACPCPSWEKHFWKTQDRFHTPTVLIRKHNWAAIQPAPAPSTGQVRQKQNSWWVFLNYRNVMIDSSHQRMPLNFVGKKPYKNPWLQNLFSLVHINFLALLPVCGTLNCRCYAQHPTLASLLQRVSPLPPRPLQQHRLKLYRKGQVVFGLRYSPMPWTLHNLYLILLLALLSWQL